LVEEYITLIREDMDEMSRIEIAIDVYNDCIFEAGGCLGLQYCSYIVADSFIGGGNRSIQRNH
jgi:hypothetical protein